MKNTCTDKVPIFVAKDLHRLPPVNFENVDVTRILKDIVTLTSEIREIKDKYTTNEQLEMFKKEILLNKTTVSSRNHEPYVNINTRRGAYLYDSGPGSLFLNAKNSTVNESAANVTVRTVDDPMVHFDPISAPARTPVPLARIAAHLPAPEQLIANEPVTASVDYCEDCDDPDLINELSNINLEYRPINVSMNKKSFAEIMTEKGEWKANKQDDEGFHWCNGVL